MPRNPLKVENENVALCLVDGLQRPAALLVQLLVPRLSLSTAVVEVDLVELSHRLRVLTHEFVAFLHGSTGEVHLSCTGRLAAVSPIAAP